MYTYGDKNKIKKRLILYISITLFCGIFSAIYEHFSHGVYSSYMISLFAFPLIGGVLPQILLMTGRIPYPSVIVSRLYHTGIATLSVGCCMTGIFEIYGSASALTKYYWYAGLALLLVSVLLYGISLAGRRRISNR